MHETRDSVHSSQTESFPSTLRPVGRVATKSGWIISSQNSAYSLDFIRTTAGKGLKRGEDPGKTATAIPADFVTLSVRHPGRLSCLNNKHDATVL